MANPIFRFTLSHDVLGSLQISEPDGWKDAILKLERHAEFHTLIEYFNGSFIFYGNNGRYNGGVDFIRDVERDYGFDATLLITIEASFNSGTSYDTIFIGQLDLSQLEETEKNKIKAPIIRNDFWSKFISRLDSPVSLQSTTDLDGNAVTPVTDVTLHLLPQTVRTTFYGETKEFGNLVHIPFIYSLGVISVPITIDSYFQIDVDNNITEELKEKYNIPVDVNPLFPAAWNVEAVYAGVYHFNIVIYAAMSSGGPLGPILDGSDVIIPFYLKIGPTEYAFAHSVEYYNGIDSSDGEVSKFTYSGSFDIVLGTYIWIYGRAFENHSGTTLWWMMSTLTDKSSISIIADTVHPQTEANAILLHDAGGAITDRVIGESNSFYSEYLGSSLTNYRTYAEDGCGWPYALLRGLQLRQYYLSDKPFSISFNQWWKGINPILNLSLGYDTVAGNEVIRVENIASAYDDTIIAYIDYVKSISRTYDDDLIFNKIEVGYNKWQSEEASGIDDVQTKHTYTTILKKSGKSLNLLSDFIAASLAIETTRRTTKEKSADYKFDNETFIIKINPDDTSPDSYVPELDENFDSVSNVLNAETRYNLTLTPLRNLLRWGDFWNGCLQSYQSSDIKFVSGEGNCAMTSDYHVTGNACAGTNGVIGDILAENQDIPLGAPFQYGSVFGLLHLPIAYEIDINMSWDTYKSIRENRNNAIGISQTNSNHIPFFIKSLEYQICKSRAKIIGWPKRLLTITNTPWIAPSVTCIPTSIEARITEDGEYRVTEDDEVRIIE